MGKQEIWAFTKDISTRSVYFRTAGEDDRPSIGDLLDFVIKIPPSMSYSMPCFIKGKGRTIRVDDLGGNEAGVVIEIIDLSIQSQTSPENSEEQQSHNVHA